MDMISYDEALDFLSKLLQRLKKLQFSNKSQLAFLEDFYTLVNDGIPANRAIEMMAQVTTGINREVAISIGQKISEGQPLAEGMRDWFAINVVEIIRVGEEGGALVETVRSAINTLGQRNSTIGAFTKAITYPTIVISVACIMTVYLNSTVFVQFKAIKPMSQWPDAGKQFVYFAGLIQDWWWLALIVIGAVLIVLRSLMNNYVGEFRPMLDKIPPFSLYRRFVSSRFLETLGLLVANGVVFKSAIRVMQYQANPYLASHLVMMEHLLSMGRGNIADVLATGLVSNSDVLRLRVMAEVKGFEHGLVRMGVRGSEENLKTVQLIARILGGAMLGIGALMIIMIIRGIYLTGMSLGV